ncbi:hypothetical protein HUA74_37625 [Myxococcus sp. CA051A]|uniref:Uncharacterized protein n=1 Tax=Myxococcus llanfairpwllgwyngyllgogerychwyrndrobwllllantysiliogogogochensis TaxID=2590453 RepID=A0A540WTA0_9BACT|nr:MULTISPECIES: hypothetical protein [Myxococcus]NTX12863.1 hypothetical protein [Myxococcus sp. CA056]NTX66394.1 hypothetical protein [Myxococcus sp. CA051A]TQF11644.1 hypothetical protein FJV41_33160 [Myxococcus llanfairpwllgwyngyllgogerychwyrndrobwllllantysiliogogogochensis]
MLDEGRHATCVDAWLDRADRNLSTEAFLQLFEAALTVLWKQTLTTLGEVTLSAIAGRVLHNASEQFPLFSSLKVERQRGLQFEELRAQVRAGRDSGLREGSRFVLVEFLTVLGNLTAEILTPELHAELSKVALPEAVRPRVAAGEDTTS